MSTSAESATGVRETVSTTKGRPRKDILKDQLEYLLSLRFTWKEIASLVGVSAKTVRRRAEEWDITKYTPILDEDLKDAVLDIIHHFPASGEVMIHGHLQARKV